MLEEKILDLEQYLKNSENFDEFFEQAENDIWEHMEEISGNRRDMFFENDAKDYAKEIWDEYINLTIPF